MPETLLESAARAVRIPAREAPLDGALSIPDGARAVVVFVQGDGGASTDEVTQALAAELGEEGLATLILDLVTADERSLEGTTERLRHDTKLLAERLALATDWLRTEGETAALRIGYFATDSAAGAALLAATMRPAAVGAIVIRRGEPEPDGGHLGLLVPPVMAIVAESNGSVEANEVALRAITSREKHLVVIPRSSERFVEAGAAAQVAQYALRWFERHLLHGQSPARPELAMELC